MSISFAEIYQHQYKFEDTVHGFGEIVATVIYKSMLLEKEVKERTFLKK